MKLNLLKAAMVKNNLNVQECARLIGMSKNTFYSRLNGTSSFTTDEIQRLCGVLKIDSVKEQADIFLTRPSQYQNSSISKEV